MGSAHDRGYMLAEVLVAMGIGAVVLTGATGLLLSSSHAVARAELETTATWIASRAIEEWRSLATPDAAGTFMAEDGSFAVRWTAEPDGSTGRLWRVVTVVVHPRLRQPVMVEAVVGRSAP